MRSRTDSQPNPRLITLERVRALSYLLDSSIPIPGTNKRIGIDPILGLLPGGGDVVGAALSAYIVIEAARTGLPRSVLLRMVANLFLDSAMGSVPIAGDFFDATWKANSKNVALLEQHLHAPIERRSRSLNLGIVLLLLAGFLLFAIALTAAGVVLLRLLFQALQGG